MEAITLEPLIHEASQLLPTAPPPIRTLRGATLAHDKVKGRLSRHWDLHEGVCHQHSTAGT